MDRDRLLALVRERLAKEPGVVVVWLFGSFARGNPRADSDVDIAILFEVEPSASSLLDLQGDLTTLLEREVQIVSARTAPVDLLHRVLRDGVLLVEHDRSKRVRFEVDVRNRYFDMQPIWIEYRRDRKGVA